jgi:transformation/transcription domain-associated protein
MCPDAWVNWGRFCDKRYLPTDPSTFHWLEFAASCYSQGIRLVGSEARALVPRLLHLLMLDVNGNEYVGRPLMNQAGEMPSWVWLPWLPQLITSLQRPEMTVARRLLMSAAQYHPQYVYWQVRPALTLLKDQALKAVAAAKEEKAKQQQQTATTAAAGGGSEAGGSEKESADKKDGEAAVRDEPATAGDKKEAAGEDGKAKEDPAAAPERPSSPRLEKPMEVIAYDHCKEVLEALRAKQSLTLQSLDLLITELGGQKFSSRTDERLLAVVYTLQFRTYKQALPASAPIPATLKKELGSVCKACGGKDAAAASAAAAAANNAPFSWTRYQFDFARDLDPDSENTPKTLGELGERLKGWRTMMEAMIEDLHPPIIKLEEHASSLAEMLLEEIEMPCQAPPCPDGPEPVFIERIGADVEIVRRACSSSRRITVYGSDGQARTFLVQPVTQQLAPGHSEERVGQLLRAANGVMATHPESRRRGLAFSAPRSLALLPSGRLIEDDPSATLYVDAYETYCARYGREPDAPILHFKARTCSEDGTVADPQTRRAAYIEITEKMVTENVFSQYMYKTMVENSRVMWTFKRQFALSTAMSAVACYSLRLTGRIPNKILVSKAKGEITHLELSAMYNDRLQLDMAGETVPFRLTRNMSAFIGPHGFEGTLIAAAVAAAQGLQQERSPIASMLALFLRDDLLAYAQRRLVVRSIAAVNLKAAQVDMATTSNVHQCLGRLEKIGPGNSVTPATVPGTQTLANPQAGMRELVTVAMSANQLCQMDPTFMAWL